MSYHDKNTPTTNSQRVNTQGQTAPTGFHYMPDGSLMADAAMLSTSVCDIDDAMAVGMCGSIANIPCGTSLPGSLHHVYDVVMGTPSAYFTFLFSMMNHFSNSGCGWWANRVTHWTSQLPGITGANHLLLKTTKIAFAQEMHDICNCPGPTPSIIIPLAAKTINSFDLDLKDIKAAGETRKFTISGTKNSVFSLEITNEDSKYYNFQTNLFQTAKTKLNNASVLNNSYSGRITFPTVTDADQYDFTLTAEQGTSHNGYSEVRFGDGSIDINSSTGSNSNILKKVIYQTLDTTITLSNYSGGSLITSITNVEQTIAASRGKAVVKTPFEIKVSVAAGALTIDRQPLVSDIMAFVERTIGSVPVKIPGENMYPVVTTAADSTSEGGTTVNGSSTGQTVTTHVVSSTIATVGDRVLGNAALAATTVTVTAVSSGSGKTFTISSSISIADDLPLSFSNQRNYRWPVDNIHLLADGTKVKASASTNGFTDEVTIKEYLDETTIFEDEINEQKLVNERVPGLDTLSVKPTLTRNGTTNVNTIVQTGNVSFSEQALLIMKETTQKFFGYGLSEISRLTSYDVIFSDLKAELNTVTTTSSAAVSASTTIPVTSKVGIVDKTTQTVDGATLASRDVVLDSVTGLGIGQSLYVGTGLVGTPVIRAINETTKKITLSTIQTFADGITLTFPNSIISGIGIDSSAVNPYVNTISSLNLTSSVAQTLEDAQTFTFTGAGDIVTITGNIIVNNVGNEDVTLRFDIDRFLTQH